MAFGYGWVRVSFFGVRVGHGYYKDFAVPAEPYSLPGYRLEVADHNSVKQEGSCILIYAFPVHHTSPQCADTQILVSQHD